MRGACEAEAPAPRGRGGLDAWRRRRLHGNAGRRARAARLGLGRAEEALGPALDAAGRGVHALGGARLDVAGVSEVATGRQDPPRDRRSRQLHPPERPAAARRSSSSEVQRPGSSTAGSTRRSAPTTTGPTGCGWTESQWDAVGGAGRDLDGHGRGRARRLLRARAHSAAGWSQIAYFGLLPSLPRPRDRRPRPQPRRSGAASSSARRSRSRPTRSTARTPSPTTWRGGCVIVRRERGVAAPAPGHL